MTDEPTPGMRKCGYVRTEWDGPYRMDHECTASAGHGGGHGPWRWFRVNGRPAADETDLTEPVEPADERDAADQYARTLRTPPGAEAAAFIRERLRGVSELNRLAPGLNLAAPTSTSVDLAARIAAALREAAHDCDGHCGMSEAECIAAHPVQVASTAFGEPSDVYGPINAIAEAVAEVVDAEVTEVRGELAKVRDQAAGWESAATEWAVRATSAEMRLAVIRRYAEKMTAGSIRVAVPEGGRDLLRLLDGEVAR